MVLVPRARERGEKLRAYALVHWVTVSWLLSFVSLLEVTHQKIPVLASLLFHGG